MNPINVVDKSYKYDGNNNLIEYRIHNDPYPPAFKRECKYNEENQLIEWVEFTEEKIFKIVKYLYDEGGKRTLIYYKKLKKKPDEVYIEKYEYW
jgi:hypothetical protein